MQDEIKVKILSGIAIAGILAAGVLGYLHWQLSRELTALEASRAAPPPVVHLPTPDELLPSPPEFTTDPWEANKDILEQFREAEKHMNELIHSMQDQQSFFNQHSFGFSGSDPKIRMTETGQAYQITIEVPDGKNVEINTSLKDNMFTISGKIQSRDKKVIANGSEQRSSYSQFSQSIYLPNKINEQAIISKQEGNKTTITLPKLQPLAP